MKEVNKIALLALCICIATISSAEESRIPKWVKNKADFQRWTNQRLVKEMLESSELVICKPGHDGNMVVTKVLRGYAKVGQFWNDGTTGKKLLICETFGHNWSQSTHYNIDQKGNIYKRGLYKRDSTGMVIINLKKLEELLQKTEQDASSDR